MGEVVFIHLTNTLKLTSHLKKIRNMISTGKISGYVKTILILSGEFNRVIAVVYNVSLI